MAKVQTMMTMMTGDGDGGVVGSRCRQKLARMAAPETLPTSTAALSRSHSLPPPPPPPSLSLALSLSLSLTLSVKGQFNVIFIEKT